MAGLPGRQLDEQVACLCWVGGRELGEGDVYCNRAVGECQLVRVVCSQRRVSFHWKGSSVLPSHWAQ